MKASASPASRANRSPFFLSVIVFLLAVISGCASSVGGGVAESFDASSLDNSEVMLVDSQIRVYELSLSGSEEVPEWSKEAKAAVDASMKEYLSNELDWQISATPELSPEELSVLEEHVALYELLALQHLNRTTMNGWVKHRPDFDVTLGPGLSFLKDSSDYNFALLSIGEEYNTSGGRAAANVLMAVAFGTTLPTGHAMLHVGLVDIETGALTWTNTAISTSHNLKDETGSSTMVKQAFKNIDKAPE